jgi:hypothetical protein
MTMGRQYGGTTTVLDMFRSVLATADRRLADAQSQVVPVIATDLVTDLPLIEQIARHAEAPILIANWGPAPAVDGVEPSDSLSLLRNVIESVELPVGRLQLVDIDDQHVAARIGSEPTPSNPGLRNVLGALTAIIDRNLGGQRLGIIAYDESNIDKVTQDLLWQVLMKELPTSGASMPRTLLLIVGNENLSVEHLDADPTVRYVLRPAGLVERHSREVDEREIAELAAGEEPLVLFLGAGASVASGLPLGDTLRNEALRRFFHDNVGAPIAELIDKFFVYVDEHDRFLSTEQEQDQQYFIDNLTLERVLREEKHQEGAGVIPATLRDFAALEEAALKVPSAGVTALRDLVGIRSRLVLVTVNFDRLVESGGARIAVMASDEQFREGIRRLRRYIKTGQGAVPLLKLHGTIEDPLTIVADVETTALGLSGPKADALSLLAGDASTPYKWAYVGYSMRDPDITAELRGKRFADGTNERWVAPMADPTVGEFVRLSRVPFWEARKVAISLHERMISRRADGFFTQLLTAAREAITKPGT